MHIRKRMPLSELKVCDIFVKLAFVLEISMAKMLLIAENAGYKRRTRYLGLVIIKT